MKLSDEDQRLIKVFTQQRVDQLNESHIRQVFAMQEIATLQNKPNYDTAFQRVRAAKLAVERIMDGYEAAEDQALQCLAQLAEERNHSSYITENFEVLRQLIEAYCGPEWPDSIQQEYSRRSEVIGHWNDVFISYTNRDAYATNQTYAELILLEWGEAINPGSERNNYSKRLGK
jgi:hypothetical protein